MSVPLHSGLSRIIGPFEAVLCDLWGCVHDGLKPFPEAVDALRRLRAGGRKAILLSNAPRPFDSVERQLDRMGVPADCWDAIVTSGDATAVEFNRSFAGRSYWRLGPERDEDFFRLLQGQAAPPAEAELIVASGLFDDEQEKSADYEPLFEKFVKAGSPLICANPDIVVNRGAELVECAGALAELYERMGGVAHRYGKPHPPIYRLALERVKLPKEKILAIGDGLPTDVAGAAAFGVHCAWIAGGIHAADLGPRPTPESVAMVAAAAGHKPSFALPALVW
jgi:HAD superfamily hydrolase (TIGR01459 family)